MTNAQFKRAKELETEIKKVENDIDILSRAFMDDDDAVGDIFFSISRESYRLTIKKEWENILSIIIERLHNDLAKLRKEFEEL